MTSADRPPGAAASRLQQPTPWISGTVPADPASVTGVRHAIVDFATRHGAPAKLAGRVGLAVSEAVHNCVAHAYRDGEGIVYFAADVDDGDLEIVVADEGGGIREDTESDGLGLGLRLIAAVTTDFALTARPRGLEVWMRFALDG